MCSVRNHTDDISRNMKTRLEVDLDGNQLGKDFSNT